MFVTLYIPPIPMGYSL